MKQRMDFLTLSVPDLDQARRFYLDGLGWTATLDVPDEVIFLQLNHGLLVALFRTENFARDLLDDPDGPIDLASVRPGIGFGLAHNVDSPAEVDEVLAQAEAAGGRVIKHGQQAAFGGYHGYFADPAGIRWEVAHNAAWRVEPDGRARLGLLDE
jgi:catechol 2,3-dioxygenase-like lactoylglutathione lyase family enzyme